MKQDSIAYMNINILYRFYTVLSSPLPSLLFHSGNAFYFKPGQVDPYILWVQPLKLARKTFVDKEKMRWFVHFVIYWSCL